MYYHQVRMNLSVVVLAASWLLCLAPEAEALESATVILSCQGAPPVSGAASGQVGGVLICPIDPNEIPPGNVEIACSDAERVVALTLPVTDEFYNVRVTVVAGTSTKTCGICATGPAHLTCRTDDNRHAVDLQLFFHPMH